MASTQLNKTLGTPTSNYKWTISCWVKRAALGDQTIMSARVDSSNNARLYFNSSNQLSIVDYQSTNKMELVTSSVYRDVGAWYSIVVSSDNSIGSPVTKIYVNGTETTNGTSTQYSQNQANLWNSAIAHYIGQNGASASYFDGSMTHFHFVDGTAYAASTFGETDSTSGIWKPKTSPSVTYGSNGFFLKFENSGAMGTDSSGQSNTFTVSGTLTQNVDTPENNFATFNSVYKANSNPTYTNGNLTATSSGSGYRVSFSTLNNSTGKWYAEFKRAVGSSDEVFIGVSGEIDVNTSFGVNDRYMGETSKSIGISSGNGSSYIAGSATTYAASYGTNDIIGIALDLTNKKLYASKNGAWSNGSGAWSSSTFDAAVGAIDISSLIPSGEFGYIGCSNTGTSTLNANFGQGYFGTTAVASANADANGNGIMEYPVPSGFYTLNTKNIKEFG